jgi:hypothetical protein
MSIAELVHQLTATPGCQLFNRVGEHPVQQRTWQEIRLNCGLRTNLRRRRSAAEELGAPSRYAEGDWVQVLGPEELKRTLNAQSKTRGLLFLDYQWPFCGGVYQVQKVMRRIVDDNGIFRPVNRTVLLEGVDCGGVTGTSGCGRACPLMFRDEWVKPAPAPAAGLAAKPAATQDGVYKRVRLADEILVTLDGNGKRDGLGFMPEMYRWAGQRFKVAKKMARVYEYGRYADTPIPIYILEGPQCSGAVLGRKAPCDRGCAILWHGDWLRDDV